MGRDSRAARKKEKKEAGGRTYIVGRHGYNKWNQLHSTGLLWLPELYHEILSSTE